MRLKRAPLVALGLGAGAYLLTREVIVGLLVAAASYWFLRGGPSSRKADTDTPRFPPATLQPERATGMRVVCKRITAERQEWASVKTGRIFEVLAQNGPPGAKPGDPGEVVSSPAGTRIVARALSDD